MQQNEPETLCSKCNKFIRTQNYLIHEARCQGPFESNNRPSSRLQMQSRVSNRPENNSRSGPRSEIQEEERIPCVFCGYGQTLAELDTHPYNCQHREEECQGCLSHFPRSLMSQHVMFCPANQRNQNNPFMGVQNNNNNYRQSNNPFEQRRQEFEQEDNFMNYPTNQNNVSIRNNNNNFQNYHNFEEERRPIQQQDGPSMINMIFNQMMNPQMNGRPSRSRQRQIQSLENLAGLIQMLASNGMMGHQEEEVGLSKEEIAKFPIKKYVQKGGKSEDEEKCVVCYCNFEQGEEFMQLPCKHVFHPECISHWLEKNPTCPVCKHNFGEPREERPRNQPNMFFRVYRF